MFDMSFVLYKKSNLVTKN